MSASLQQTVRFRIAFGVWWAAWATLHFVALQKAGYPAQAALIDSVISNTLLGGAALLVAQSLRFYLPSQNRYVYLVVLCGVLTALWLSVSRALLLLLLEDNRAYGNFFSQWIVIRGATGFLVISCMALIGVLWYTLQDQKETELRKTEADKLAREAELNNLRQQLQPHFLFNSLNSINALVVSQPQKARTMIHQLSAFLRGTLKKDEKEWVSLEEELEHLQLYLEIEKVRFGHRLSAVIQNETSGTKLPVMLLQPVVENAIKFGLYDTTGETVIKIGAKEENSYLILQIENPFDPETASPKSGTGFGLRSVQRRLHLLFARTDLLHTSADATTFTTTIKIPQS